MKNQELSVDVYDEYIQQKAQAIKSVYRKWGKILVNALKQATPDDRGRLKQSFNFRVEPIKSRVQVGDQIRLLVGILEPSSPILKYFRYITRGTRSHFVPVRSNGKYTGILGWAQRHGLVSRKGKQWIWSSGKNAGKPFHGFRSGLVANDFFNDVYKAYYRRIQMDVRRILESKL